MNKLFKLAQAKGKWHKSPSFNLGGGAKLYKNFAQKLLAVSLCMAVVLLGVPRGQNFVAEAADEATKSLVLLTLTLTDDEDEPLKADMTWKKFIPGTTVDLELKFVKPDDSVAGQVNLMDWVASGSLVSFVPPFLYVLDLDSLPFTTCAAASDHGTVFAFNSSGACVAAESWGLLESSFDLVPPLRCAVARVWLPGLARVSPGGSVAFATSWFGGGFGDSVYSCTSSDPSVALYEDGYIRGLSEGTATLTFNQNGSDCGAVEVAVGDWVPPHEVPAGLTAVAGTRLGDVALPAPTAAGAWVWVHPDALLTTPGPATHKALYTPTDIENYGSAIVDVPVEVYLEQTVTVKGKQQRLRVYNPNNVLPDGTLFEALAVTEHEHLDSTHEVEHLWSYDLSLMDAQANPLHMPLDAPVELLFEVPDGLDKDELEVVLVKEFEDAEFEEELVTIDGSSWVKVKTDHFSPYVLIDRLSAEEKAARNVPTGDQAVQMAVTGLGMVLVLALGVMLRLITGKKKFEE